MNDNLFVLQQLAAEMNMGEEDPECIVPVEGILDYLEIPLRKFTVPDGVWNIMATDDPFRLGFPNDDTPEEFMSTGVTVRGDIMRVVGVVNYCTKSTFAAFFFKKE